MTLMSPEQIPGSETNQNNIDEATIALAALSQIPAQSTGYVLGLRAGSYNHYVKHYGRDAAGVVKSPPVLWDEWTDTIPGLAG